MSQDMNLRAVWARYAPTFFILFTGSALSLTLGYLAQKEITRSAQVRFDSKANTVARKVEDQFDAYTEVLIGLRALFNTTDQVNRRQFKHYVDGLNLRTHFPGFDVLNFAPYVPGTEKQAFEERMRNDTSLNDGVASKFAIHPAGTRNEYLPITLVEPLAGFEALLGRDLATMPQGTSALYRARDTGGLLSSGRLLKLKGNSTDIGMAVRLPVYRTGMPIDTVEQRRAAYIGSVGAGFRVANMMRDIVGSDTGFRLRLFDGGPSAERGVVRADRKLVPTDAATPENALLFDSAAPSNDQPPQEKAAGREFERKLTFEIAGRVWMVHVTEDANLVVGRLDRAIPWFIVFCGLAISILLACIVYSLSTSRRRAVELATEMTKHLRTSERRLDEAQRLASLGSWVLDPVTGLLSCSDEARRILGFDATMSTPDLDALLSRVPEAERASVARDIVAASTDKRSEFEHRLELPDGTQRWVHAIVEQTEEDGKTTLRGTLRDDTQRQKVALRLQFEHNIAKLLVSDGEPESVIARALDAICTHLHWDYGAAWSVGADGLARCGPTWNVDDSTLEQFVRVSRSLTYHPDEGAMGQAWAKSDAVCIETSGAAAREFTRDALARQAGLSTGVVLPMSGGSKPAALEFFSRTARHIEPELLESMRAVALQIGQYEQRKQAEQALRHLASHDALTGLSNRVSLQHSLSLAIKRSNRHQKRMAVMFVDLDRFKHINDTLGHGVGDAMIKACAERLQKVLREGDGVARFGGDEFVLTLEDLSQANDAAVIAGKVLACCAEPFFIDGRELHVTASVGVSIYPEDGTDGETLLKNADTAMYRAKDKQRGTYQFYAPQMNAQSTERLMLESGLRRAVERGELSLHYQPKMNLQTRRITGVEALMRWHHPVLGMISPAQFIPIAEETGLIESMGKWALSVACTDAKAWQQRGLPPVQMSVNLSTRQLTSPTLIEDIAEIVSDSGFDPSLLELEITESAMMKNPEHASSLLQQLRDMGMCLAIDDFGTGYSSLSYLKRFPLTTVKIDRSFVKDLSQDPDAQALTDGIITLAHGLRMKVVAEGVETVEQLSYLNSHGCDEMQGYWLCKPLPAAEVCAFMARHLHNLVATAGAA